MLQSPDKTIQYQEQLIECKHFKPAKLYLQQAMALECHCSKPAVGSLVLLVAGIAEGQRAELVSLKTSDIDSQRTVFAVQYMIWDEPSARAKASLLRWGSRSRQSVTSLTQNEGMREVFNWGLTRIEDLSGV